MMKRAAGLTRIGLTLALAAAAPLAASPAYAAEKLKVGFISTFSGPQGVLGRELLDGFQLGVKHAGGKLGGVDVEIVQGDDQAKPDVGVQLAERMLERDKVQIVTGINFSNVLLAVAKPVLENKTIYLSINAGPSQLAGAGCSPYYFNVAFQNDNVPEAMGRHLTDKGVKTAYLLAPNYPAGKDMLAGFKRFYKGQVVGEVYTQFNQPDYAAELAAIRQAKPEAVFFFYPGGMGINFLKQYAQSGLKGEVALYGPSFSLDQTVLPAVGDAALGTFSTAFWSEGTENAANKAFVEAFEAAYGRIPSPAAATGYDGARLLDAAVKAAGGKVSDREALRTAIKGAKFESVRGSFRFNTNNYPVQDYALYEVVKDAKGRLVNAYRAPVMKDHQDAYVKDCAMK
ncbi:ABC transporter substrate-binding protein [Azospirillum sp.]|uniref:ABC transporter substrate-binding protein n=1 Tax=Azospirillum sp. TaxID=34012 RepID=UPI002D55E427|nr:ABC transporter substrate-binding protein [Azospirillum sp.]HYD65717.1 ABC transporter substrate-binding protein [Azospirillum sp.]